MRSAAQLRNSTPVVPSAQKRGPVGNSSSYCCACTWPKTCKTGARLRRSDKFPLGKGDVVVFASGAVSSKLLQLELEEGVLALAAVVLASATIVDVVVGVASAAAAVEDAGVWSYEVVTVGTPGGFKPLAMLLNCVIRKRSPTPMVPFLI